MTNPNKLLLSCIFILATIGIIFISGCVQPQAELSLSYRYITEGSYFDANITNSKIVYTHTDYEEIRDKCAQWIQQVPCWTKDDLKTEEAVLTNAELSILKNLIEESKVMELDEYYGPEQGARCYPYTLEIKLKDAEKQITYCSGFDGPEQPEAFEKVTQAII